MTREQAINHIKNSTLYKYDRETADMAITALEAEPCSDAISRQAVIGSIFDDDTEYTGSEVCSMVRNLPPVNSQEPTIEAYKQVCKERDIAIEQLHELGYEWGQKIEPCDDAISRQAAIRIAKEECENGSYNDIPWKLEDLPSVQPIRQSGIWMKTVDGKEKCSECGYSHRLIIPKSYCPNCGAKMESEEQA